jgi:hypothetical protein
MGSVDETRLRWGKNADFYCARIDIEWAARMKPIVGTATPIVCVKRTNLLAASH